MGENTGPSNHNWRGGRVLTPDGYMLIRVGAAHHLADVRGYAYEHRLVAEEKLGRPLQPGEQIHHRDGDTVNNEPGNIEVCESLAHHRVKHRSGNTRLRMPGELNPTVACKCGCGKTFARFDGAGREREWYMGHNPPPSPTADAIRALAKRTANFTIADLVDSAQISSGAARQGLSELTKRGELRRVAPGVYSGANQNGERSSGQDQN